MLAPGSYAEICSRFVWQVPAEFNIGVAVCDRWATGESRPALIYEGPAGNVRTFSFDELKALTDCLANVLVAHGIERGDRVGILLPQCPETLLSHIAIYKMGAVALPLFTQFGPEALEHRLQHSAARALVTDGENLPKIDAIRSSLPELRYILVVDRESGANTDFWAALERASPNFTTVDTASEDPALIIYTSGTTGKPKGALHAHRVLLGHIPGVQFPHEFFPQPGDRFWTIADWAWAGGLLDVLLPSLYFGIPVVAHRARKFDPEHAFHFIAKHKVRNAFMPPTALKLMRQVENPRARYDYAMRSIGSGGEALGEDILDWCRETFGFDVNEFYGQTEANLLVGNCSSVFPIRPGSMGRAIPGHDVEIVSPQGEVLPDGEIGVIAVRRPDPVMFIEYWRQPEATAAKFAGKWCLTGDIGIKDDGGYFWYKGREDDLISSGGYRIGPTDIEDCILAHPAVLLVAVVGAPDPIRGEIVKAFIVPRPGISAEPRLAGEIQAFVRDRLAAYQYPRAVEFVDNLPMTATGKVMRRELRQRSDRRSV
jgi:acetyl-CoA synthetase